MKRNTIAILVAVLFVATAAFAAPVTFLQETDTHVGGFPGQGTVNVPGLTMQNDLLVWISSAGAGGNNAPTAGSWTRINATTTDGPQAFYHIATNAEPASYKSSGTDANHDYVLLLFDNNLTVNPIEAPISVNSNVGAGSNTITCPTLTPTNNGDAVVFLSDIHSGGGFSASAPSGFSTLLSNSVFEATGSFDKENLTGGVPTGSMVSTFGGAPQQWYCTAFIIGPPLPTATPTATATATATSTTSPTATATATATLTATPTASATATATKTATPTATSTCTPVPNVIFSLSSVAWASEPCGSTPAPTATP